MKQIRKRLTYANVMSSIAVFLVLGGATAFAAASRQEQRRHEAAEEERGDDAKIKNSAVTTGKIANNAVTTAKLANGAVVTSKIVDASITTGKLAEKAVTTAKLADNAVNSGKLADNAVNTAKLVDSAVNANKLAGAAVTNGKLADGSVTASKIGSNAVQAARVRRHQLPHECHRNWTGKSRPRQRWVQQRREAAEHWLSLGCPEQTAHHSGLVCLYRRLRPRLQRNRRDPQTDGAGRLSGCLALRRARIMLWGRAQRPALFVAVPGRQRRSRGCPAPLACF